MIKAIKYDQRTGTSTPYEGFPKMCLYSDDIDEQIQCAQCGRGLTFGDAFTSYEIQNAFGFGYGVCEKCYENELQRSMDVAMQMDAENYIPF